MAITPTSTALIPTASVAPLDGPPDGERIEIYTLKPQGRGWTVETAAAHLRENVDARPLTAAAVAFMLGFALARLRS